jgi:hypothetical protein
VGFFYFLGVLPKNVFFRLFSAKIGPYTSSIYSESAQKTLPENIQFFDFWIIRRKFGGKTGSSGNRFIQKKNATTFYFHIFFRNYMKFATIDIKAFFEKM